MPPATKPRILFLDQTGKLGGAEFCLADIAHHYRQSGCVALFEEGPFKDFLMDRGIKVDVFPLGRDAQLIDKKARLSQMLRVIPSVFRTAIQVATHAKKYDLVYANTAKALAIGAIGSLLAARPLVFHLHDIINADHFSPANCKLIVFLCNTRATKVICNSEATARAFVASGGKENLTVVIPNGFRIEQASEESLALEKKSALPPSAPIALIAGRLTEWKGQHIFIEALVKVESLHGLIVGEALFTEADRAYAAHLKQLAKDRGIADRIHFLGFRDDIPALLRSADIVVHCSTAPEPFGRVIVEGMLCRKPVIATNQGGAQEIIRHEETGLLVEPGSIEALANALSTLIESPMLRQKMGNAAFEDAQKRFSLESVLQQIDRVLGDLRRAA